MLNKRVVEHNLRTIASYYRRIRAARLGDMLGLDPATLEAHLSEMSSDADIYVKVRAARSKLAPSLSPLRFSTLSLLCFSIISFAEEKALSTTTNEQTPPLPLSFFPDRPARGHRQLRQAARARGRAHRLGQRHGQAAGHHGVDVPPHQPREHGAQGLEEESLCEGGGGELVRLR